MKNIYIFIRVIVGFSAHIHTLCLVCRRDSRICFLARIDSSLPKWLYNSPHVISFSHLKRDNEYLWYFEQFFSSIWLRSTGGRFIITNGHKDLCIRVIRPEDAAKKFACLTTNRLSGETKISESVSLTIKGRKAHDREFGAMLKFQRYNHSC